MTERRKYTRSTNSLHCVICHEYHQTSKNGKCKNIRTDLPIFTEFLEENDPTFIKSASDSKTRTEQAIRRIMEVLQEHKQEFQEWTSEKKGDTMSTPVNVVPLVENAPRLLSYDYLKSVDLILIKNNFYFVLEFSHLKNTYGIIIRKTVVNFYGIMIR